jgi:short-subunit dehydrogenase
VSEKTVLITGASEGIGFELAKIFSREGYRLVLVARNSAKLEQAKKEIMRSHPVLVEIISEDLSVPSAPRRIFDRLQEKSIGIDILVNNAGIGMYGFFAVSDLASQKKLLQINVLTLTEMTHLFVKPMIERKEGKILNVASTAAFLPGPLMAVYYASKAYVVSFSEAIANELAGTGVYVTALCPGATATGFQERANMRGIRLLKRYVMSAQAVAEAGYRGLMKKEMIIVPGLRNRLLMASVPFVPRSLKTRMVRKIQEKER